MNEWVGRQDEIEKRLVCQGEQPKIVSHQILHCLLGRILRTLRLHHQRNHQRHQCSDFALLGGYASDRLAANQSANF